MSGIHPDETSLAASVLRAVKARGPAITPADQAAVDLALRYALQIDAGIDRGGLEATKAMHLGPHLLNTLRALGCSVDARGELDGEGGNPVAAPASKLSALRKSRHDRGAGA